MVVAMILSKTLQFQYFWDFNKCFQAIFSPLSFENVWLYLLSARLSWVKTIKNYYKSTLKVCELKAWAKYPPNVSQNVLAVQQKKLNLNFIRVIKIHLLIKVLYRHIQPCISGLETRSVRVRTLNMYTGKINSRILELLLRQSCLIFAPSQKP